MPPKSTVKKPTQPKTAKPKEWGSQGTKAGESRKEFSYKGHALSKSKIYKVGESEQNGRKYDDVVKYDRKAGKVIKYSEPRGR